MNIQSLKSKLDKAGIPSNSYQLYGGLPNEIFCISKNDMGWEIYYSERGCKTGLRVFSSESAACEHFYSMLLNHFADNN